MNKYIAYSIGAVALLGLAACERGTRDDITMASEARQELAEEKVPGAIEVTVVGGIATLTGAVPNPAAKEKAEDVVEDIDGVDRVVNNLRTTMAGDAPAAPRMLPPADIDNPMAPEAPAGHPETR